MNMLMVRSPGQRNQHRCFSHHEKTLTEGLKCKNHSIFFKNFSGKGKKQYSPIEGQGNRIKKIKPFGHLAEIGFSFILNKMVS